MGSEINKTSQSISTVGDSKAKPPKPRQEETSATESSDQAPTEANLNLRGSKETVRAQIVQNFDPPSKSDLTINDAWMKTGAQIQAAFAQV